MPLEDFYPYAVVFVLAPRRDDDGTERMAPVGTGFIVSCGPLVGGSYFTYVVTASHVVIDGAPTAIRVKRANKERPDFVDLPVSGWVHHPTADVAIAPYQGAGWESGIISVSIEEEMFVGSGDEKDWQPELGERVYFLGLFDRFRTMGERNIPMLRAGVVGAMFVADVPIGPAENVRHVTAHLIDCRSYAGFSGSPCFVQKYVRRAPRYDDPGEDRVDTQTALFGIVSGHFDMWGAARLTGDLPIDPGAVEVPMNSGVGVVTPAVAIRELLDMDEFREERERVVREKGRKKSEGDGATLDDVRTVEALEFERFEGLARKLANPAKPKP